ncbi:TetR/AcrR family transcriptional regulator, partial [Peribacillus sp. NPDC056705]|uniref:TetR/AcrR family transcriptional regulator n=1 Tax=Peribacillus sp. NPDC056705 TaxID=3345918 RepID=UPI00374A1B7E
MSSSRTKDHIIHTAIQVFNEYGTGAISTNTIAQEAGISPGNLYYHYHNKEDIIRAILKVMVKDWDSVWTAPKNDWTPSVEDLKWIIRINLQLQLKYRFFYRELIILIKADPT